VEDERMLLKIDTHDRLRLNVSAYLHRLPLLVKAVPTTFRNSSTKAERLTAEMDFIIKLDLESPC
jgi:hypothetical protein